MSKELDECIARNINDLIMHRVAICAPHLDEDGDMPDEEEMGLVKEHLRRCDICFHSNKQWHEFGASKLSEGLATYGPVFGKLQYDVLLETPESRLLGDLTLKDMSRYLAALRADRECDPLDFELRRKRNRARKSTMVSGESIMTELRDDIVTWKAVCGAEEEYERLLQVRAGNPEERTTVEVPPWNTHHVPFVLVGYGQCDGDWQYSVGLFSGLLVQLVSLKGSQTYDAKIVLPPFDAYWGRPTA